MRPAGDRIHNDYGALAAHVCDFVPPKMYYTQGRGTNPMRSLACLHMELFSSNGFGYFSCWYLDPPGCGGLETFALALVPP